MAKQQLKTKRLKTGQIGPQAWVLKSQMDTYDPDVWEINKHPSLGFYSVDGGPDTRYGGGGKRSPHATAEWRIYKTKQAANTRLYRDNIYSETASKDDEKHYYSTMRHNKQLKRKKVK